MNHTHTLWEVLRYYSLRVTVKLEQTKKQGPEGGFGTVFKNELHQIKTGTAACVLETGKNTSANDLQLQYNSSTIILSDGITKIAEIVKPLTSTTSM